MEWKKKTIIQKLHLTIMKIAVQYRDDNYENGKHYFTPADTN
jgi:hypothetical protein